MELQEQIREKECALYFKFCSETMGYRFRVGKYYLDKWEVFEANKDFPDRLMAIARGESDKYIKEKSSSYDFFHKKVKV